MTIRDDDHGYARPPASIPRVEDCNFYHSIELPGLGLQEGQWDLRPGIAKYIGGLDVRGQRVLEIGTANGFVCFELERRGAEVVAFDLPDGATFDSLPLPPEHPLLEGNRQGLRGIQNAFWLAHRLLGSRSRVVYGHANALPNFMGRFDVAMIGNVLQHLKDPVGAVIQAARICNAIVVTEADWLRGQHDDLRGMILYEGDHLFSWYQVKPRLIEAILERMGFGDVRREWHEQLLVRSVQVSRRDGMSVRSPHVMVPHFTVMARRMRP
jgi:SAM-dependent methyltransferase